MEANFRKSLFILIVSLFFIGCKESTETPPYVLDCHIHLINEDGNSPFKENKYEIKHISVKLLAPMEAKVGSVAYVEYPDYLQIQISEWDVSTRNKGNSEQEYIAEIQYPDAIRTRKDVIRIRVHFENYYPNITEAFYNDEKAEIMSSNYISYEIINK